jgi:hypothetical protein
MPTQAADHGTLDCAHHAYMNIPAGNTIAAAHAVYKRASGPRVGA